MHTRHLPAGLPFTPPPTPRPPSTPPSAIGTPFQPPSPYPAPTYLQNERHLAHAAPADTDAHVDAWLEPRLPVIATAHAGRGGLLELLWAADDLITRTKESPTLRPVAEPLPRRDVLSVGPPVASDETLHARHALRLLGADGAVTDERTLEALWLESLVDESGPYPALAHVMGELVVGLDPRAVLRAIAGLLEPVAKADAATFDALAAASAVSQDEWQTGRSIEAATEKLAGAVARSRLDLSWPHVVASARRAALERRAFAERTVLGSEHLRAMLHLGGAATGVVLYLPKALHARLPLYERLPIRAIVAIHPSQDALEPQRFALVAQALARRLSDGG